MPRNKKAFLFSILALILAFFSTFSENIQNVKAASPNTPVPGSNISSNGIVYFYDGISLRPYTSAGAFLSYGFNSWNSVQPANADSTTLPKGNSIAPRDGSLINDQGTIYIITKGARAGFANKNVFLGLGYKFSNVIVGDTSFLPTLAPISNASGPHPVDTLINDHGTIFLTTSLGRIGIPSRSIFYSWGYAFSQVVAANSFDSIYQSTSLVLSQRPAAELSAFNYISNNFSNSAGSSLSVPGTDNNNSSVGNNSGTTTNSPVSNPINNPSANNSSATTGTSPTGTDTISSPASSAPNINNTGTQTGIGIDANTSVDQSSAVSSITSRAFSTTAPNELLLALIAVDGPTSTNRVSSVSGAGLTWALVKQTNSQLGSAEIWRAFAANTLSSAKVTAKFNQPGNASMLIMSFTNTGANNGGTNGSGGIGATASGSASSGAPAVILNTTKNNSLVIGVGHDWDASIARTIGPSQTLLHQAFGNGGSTSWMQRYNGTAAAAGTSITLNDPAPSDDRYNFTAAEIIPSGSNITPNPSPDTTPPTVAITSPANGSTQTGTITITANASDNVAVAGVTFKLDGSNLGGEITSAPYSATLNTSNLTNGSHSLTAVARDTSNNTAASAAVNITVNNTVITTDTTPPTVTTTSPANGSTVSGNVSLSATASDPDDAVASVQFRIDGNNVGSGLTSSPYQLNWDSTSVSNGSHSLTALATDSHGNSATSASIAITVSNTVTTSNGQWFVRTDGGTAAQCTGRANLAYPGSGTNQACAFSNPHYLWGNDVSGETAKWKIAGGDTVIIANGSYRIGYKGPNSTDSWGQCPGDPYDCSMPPVPSGTPSQHTKILGQNFANCVSMPELHGGYGLSDVIDLSGSKFVDLGCLEITDHASCGTIGLSNECNRSFPLDDYAKHGILMSGTTQNINLSDLNIHGLSNDGILGPNAGGVTATRVRIAGNTASGWDFDNGNGTPTTGTTTLSYVTVEWNGCSEQYPSIGVYDNCFDDNSGGYGDGVGTPDTGGTFIIDHSTFRYNTQDGLDFLHVNGAGAVVIETNNTAYGNMGNQMKEGPATATFQNNTVIGNCKRLQSAFAPNPSSYNAKLSDFCRANGDAVVIGTNDNAHAAIQNNSVTSNYSIAFDIQCLAQGGGQVTCGTGSHVNFDNNLIYGFPDLSGTHPFISAIYEQGQTLDYMAATGGSRKNNLLFHTNTTCGASPAVNEVCADPLLTSESDINNMDFHLTTSSSAKDKGLTISSLGSDFDGISRPQGTAYDIGAYEFH